MWVPMFFPRGIRIDLQIDVDTIVDLRKNSDRLPVPRNLQMTDRPQKWQVAGASGVHRTFPRQREDAGVGSLNEMSRFEHSDRSSVAHFLSCFSMSFPVITEV
jgi:hypothetical protein